MVQDNDRIPWRQFIRDQDRSIQIEVGYPDACRISSAGRETEQEERTVGMIAGLLKAAWT